MVNLFSWVSHWRRWNFVHLKINFHINWESIYCKLSQESSQKDRTNYNNVNKILQRYLAFNFVDSREKDSKKRSLTRRWFMIEQQSGTWSYFALPSFTKETRAGSPYGCKLVNLACFVGLSLPKRSYCTSCSCSSLFDPRSFALHFNFPFHLLLGGFSFALWKQDRR